MFFRDEYGFLSNMYQTVVPFTFEGQEFAMPSSENAFQAMKVYASSDSSENKLKWLREVESASPYQSKALGKRLRIDVSKWNSMSMDCMETVLRLKFAAGSPLAKKLIATGDIELVEDNTWGDTLWGRVNGKGQNRLGILLMKIREDLNKPTLF